MTRTEMYRRLRAHSGPWDMIVVGGGATGVGVAIDAASRGYDVLLLEQSDFGKGTSSRSTKLVHGGVRYLEQGNVSLVMEALKERGLLLQNAPHLVRNLGFVVPNYDWWEAPFYGIGLKLYNLLAGKYGFGASRILSREETLERLPTIKPEGLRGGVHLFRRPVRRFPPADQPGGDRLRTGRHAAQLRAGHGTHQGRRRIRGRRAIPRPVRPAKSSRSMRKVVINATGPFADALRRKADPAVQPMIAPSQGIHLVFDRSFLRRRQRHHGAAYQRRARDVRHPVARSHRGRHDRHADCRAYRSNRLPWSRKSTSSCKLRRSISPRRPRRADILSVFAGIRPLVRSGEAGNTAALSRDHTIRIENSGMITICGGKWTTYRHMAEDCVNQAATLARLPEKPCVTEHLNIHGFHPSSGKFGRLWMYGSDAPFVEQIDGSDPALAEPLDGELPYTSAEVIWAVREEMARSIEDVLARRTRALFLNSHAALRAAPRVAHVMAAELKQDAKWEAEQLESFRRTAAHYVV